MTMLSRRELLKVGTQAAALALVPSMLRGSPPLVDLGRGRLEPVPPIEDPDVKALALRAIEASRAAGAAYADVRLTHTHIYRTDQAMDVGVRALVNGYWGFAASPIWTPDEMRRLGQEAVHQAKANAVGPARPVELVPVPKVVDGHWTMPVTFDPFARDPGEMSDVLESIRLYAQRYRGRSGSRGRVQARVSTTLGIGFWYSMQEKAFASTEGSYCTQRLYQTSDAGGVRLSVSRGNQERMGFFDFQDLAGLGFELFPRGEQLRDRVWQRIAEIEEDLSIPDGLLEVGRYDTLLDARVTAELLTGTVGVPTQLDRALGYEANAGGTSYLKDPFGMLGNHQMGAELMTVTANRTELGGAATVQWDDEGAPAEEFPLVKDGVLVDFLTTRESAGWLKDVYAKQQRAVRSHGCANAPTGVDAPLAHTPNLVLAPGREAQDFDALVRTMKDGIAVKAWGTQGLYNVDFQGLNGMVEFGLARTAYRVKGGRLVAKIRPNPGIMYRAPELWKGLLALGGAQSMMRFCQMSSRGEPSQAINHSVTAPPALFKQLTVIDPKRKA